MEGASIKVTSKRGVVTYVDPEVSMFLGFNTNQVGQNSAQFTYNGKSITYTYTVNDYIKGIQLTEPIKTEYEYKEELDLRGGFVQTIMASGATTIPQALNNTNTTGYNKNEVGIQLLTVSYEGKTTSFYVTVEDTTPPVITLNRDENEDAEGIVTIYSNRC